MSSEIKADKWSPASGTAGTIGDSGDTFTLTAGANLTLGGASTTVTIPSGATIVNSGTATGFGMSDLSPAFAATMSGNMSVAEDTYHKIQFGVEVLDTDGCYDHSSNYRFTPNVAGKYLITLSNSIQKVGSGSQMSYAYSQIHKNGSVVYTTYTDFSGNYGYAIQGTVSGVIDFNGSSDYVEAYAYSNTNDSANIDILGGVYSNFYGVKIAT